MHPRPSWLVLAIVAGCGLAEAGTFTHIATLQQPISGVVAADADANI